jgi:hypothetical protein
VIPCARNTKTACPVCSFKLAIEFTADLALLDRLAEDVEMDESLNRRDRDDLLRRIENRHRDVHTTRGFACCLVTDAS